MESGLLHHQLHEMIMGIWMPTAIDDGTRLSHADRYVCLMLPNPRDPDSEMRGQVLGSHTRPDETA